MKRPYVPFLAALAFAVALVGVIAFSGSSPGTPAGYHRNKDGTLTIENASRPVSPAFMGADVDGRPIQLSDFAGKTVVVNAWSSRCEPCRKEIPVLVRYHRKMEKQGVVVLGINRDQFADEARGFVREFDMPYPSVLDPRGKQFFALPKGLLSTQGLPVTLVIDARGRIAATASGPVGEGRLEGLVAAAQAS
ncbi:TlpA family protein disulfide reductase [Streptomyces sp. NBC_01005]|uniref:TlpA family protein disulfide reductase n=1 Tax=Streptomyces sp. NBC_01005 TaxID=2903715 RepID=UPI0038681A6C|nr:TlpA family protein disulfide reductase [Streptomyces sp. NBC_01005]